MQELPQILLNGLIIGGVYSLVAIGYSLVYGVMRLINFAHGAVFTAGAFATLFLADELRLPLWLVVPIILLFGAVAGILMERLAYRPIRTAPPIVALITALGLAIIIENSIAMLFGSDARSLPPGLLDSKLVRVPAGLKITDIQAWSLALSLALLGITWLIIMKSAAGISMRAVADDSEMAVSIGLDTNRIASTVFALGSSIGTVAGLIVAADVGCDPYMGTVVGFKAFAACVIGGIGRLEGAVAGGIAIGVVENLVAGYLSTEYKNAAVMAVLIILLLTRPDGLFSSWRRRRGT